jgi:phosphatidate cytidylyltransferase
MGALLIVLSAAVLTLDQRLAPWFPFLLLLLLVLAGVASWELVLLLPADQRPSLVLCVAGVWAVILANWPAHLPAFAALSPNPWTWVTSVLSLVVLVFFVVEMAALVSPGPALARIALATWVAVYLGLLPCLLAQLRWLPTPTDLVEAGGRDRGTLALALAIFVPKCGDIGAYFTGRLLGRHPMAPVLSPKKTWEGAAGGLALAMAAALGIDALSPIVPYGIWGAAGCGLSLGIAGIIGDLAESLIKRAGQHKDASHVVPGFGGVLDVVDSIVFSAPIAYLWLA